jgi:hypothetical protein
MPREGRTVAYFSVDRLEGKYAVLIGDGGSQHEVPRNQLPKGTTESSVLEVSLDDSGRPDWAGARLDPAERERRMQRALALLEELKRRDPGGDMVL